jgi:hypothetical protein
MTAPAAHRQQRAHVLPVTRAAGPGTGALADDWEG